jgi:predicted acyl esterase
MLLRGQAAVATPGSEPVETTVDLGHTGHRLEPGHRLRLHIASSDYPLYVPHPGTAESPWTATVTAQNRQTLHCGGATPSELRLTVLPSASAG